MKRGVIDRVSAPEGSGLLTLFFTDGERVHAEAGPFWRAWGYDRPILGQEILYAADQFNVLIGFDYPEEY